VATREIRNEVSILLSRWPAESPQMTKHFSSRPRRGFQDFNAVLIMNLERGRVCPLSLSRSASVKRSQQRPGKPGRVSARRVSPRHRDTNLNSA